MTPLLIFVASRPRSRVASVASHIAASSFSGAISYWRRRAIDPALALVLLSGGTIGTRSCLDLHAAALAWQLDLLIALSYVILLTTVGGLMFWEGLRAILRARRGRRGADAPLGQPRLEFTDCRSKCASSAPRSICRDTGRCRRPDHRLYRCGDGHWRRFI